MQHRFKDVTKPVEKLTCPECGGPAPMTTWKPPEGYDKGMRQYLCSKCGEDYYLIFVNLDYLARVDKQVLARSAAH